MKAPVNKIIPFSAVDGPGNRTAIFLQGCTFNCRYCHNPETIHPCIHCGACVSACPAGALTMVNGEVAYDYAACVQCDTCIQTCPNLSSPRIRWMTADEAMAEVRKNIPFVRGITVSGGECTMHRDFLLDLAKLAKAEGMSVLLDSNGGYDFAADGELTDAIDGVMLDVKAWADGEHRLLTDVSNEIVLKNLSFLAETGKLEEVRTVAVPDLMDAEQTVRNVSQALVRAGAAHVRYKIIRFRPMGVRGAYKSLRIPTEDDMKELESAAHACGVKNTVLI